MTIDLRTIQQQIAALPRKKMTADEQAFVQRYLGTKKKVLGVSTKEMLKVAIATAKENLPIKELVKILDGLFSSDIAEEHMAGGKIFTVIKPEVRSQISLSQLEKWIAACHGWVENDVICQTSFTAKEVKERWNEWEKMIQKFSNSSNISLRRASLVLQTKSNKELFDLRFRKLGYETIEQLKHEKDVLITKAISWLLRSLTVQDKEDVKYYIREQESTLPRIAVRETLNKINTGKK